MGGSPDSAIQEWRGVELLGGAIDPVVTILLCLLSAAAIVWVTVKKA